jgi:ACS family sodium-dependent inorganic phosphate cotransporter-like MFS transporter 5
MASICHHHHNTNPIRVLLLGQPLGTVVALSGSGFLASTSAGWPMVFYVSGGLGLVSAFIWLWLVADSPAQHRLTSVEECQYIESSIGGAKRDSKQVQI